MKVIGLISGGKDSFCALYDAIVTHSLELSALAHISSLRAESMLGGNFSSGLQDLTEHDSFEVSFDSNGEEADLWMYQSVGSEVVPFYALCTAKPIYILPLPPRENERALNLSQQEGDQLRRAGVSSFADPADSKREFDFELLSLYKLLAHIKQQHPKVQGIVSGAIASNYQRTRIEAICRALELRSISPLWQLNQSKLIKRMTLIGLQSILVKVSCYGLGPRDLGESLTNLTPKLLRLHDQFGINVCGEGGEYETLTMDLPILFKKHCLSIVSSESKFHTSENLVTPTVLLSIKKLRVTSKLSPAHQHFTTIPELSYKDALSWMISRRQLSIISQMSSTCFGSLPIVPLKTTACDRIPTLIMITQQQSLFFYCSNYCEDEQVENAACAVMSSITAKLQAHGLIVSMVAFVRITITSTEDMPQRILRAAVDDIYRRWLLPTHPPCCVTMMITNKSTHNLPSPVRVKMQLWGWSGNENGRDVCHIESFSSHLPPSNGPRAQAHSIAFSLVDYFGTILPVHPMTMQVPAHSTNNTFIDTDPTLVSLDRAVAEFTYQLTTILKHLKRLAKIRCYQDELCKSVMSVVLYVKVDAAIFRESIGSLPTDQLDILRTVNVLKLGELTRPEILVESSLIATKFGSSCINFNKQHHAPQWESDFASSGWVRVEDYSTAKRLRVYTCRAIAHDDCCSYELIQIALQFCDEESSTLHMMSTMGFEVLSKMTKQFHVSPDEILSADLYYEGDAWPENVKHDILKSTECLNFEQISILNTNGEVSLVAAILCLKTVAVQNVNNY